MLHDRNMVNWSRIGRANALPFFIYGIFIISLFYGGTTQFPLFLVRTGIILLFFLSVRKRELFFSRVLMAPLVALFFLVLISSGMTAKASAIWPSLQWSLNITLCLFFLVGLLQGIRERSIDSGSFTIILGVTVLGEFLIQLVQAFSLNIPRPPGTFFNPNFLAEFYSISGCLCLSRVIVRDRVREKGEEIFIVPFLVSVLGLILTGSRGGYLSFFAGVTIIFLYRFKVKGAIVAIAIAISLILFPTSLKKRFFESHDVYRYSRMEIYKSGLEVFSDHPSGIGLGNFKYYFPSHNFPVYEGVTRYGKRAKTLHNEHIQVLVEQGVIGMIAYLIFLFSTGILIFRRGGRGPKKWVRVGVAGALTSVGVHAFFDSVFHTFALPLLALILLAFMAEGRKHGWDRLRTTTLIRACATSLSLLLLVITLGTGAGHLLTQRARREFTEGHVEKSLETARLASYADPLSGKNMEIIAALNFKSFLLKGDARRYYGALDYLNKALQVQERADWLFERKAYLLSVGVLKGLFRGEEVKGVQRSEVEAYSRALELNPYNVVAMKNRALLLMELGKRKEALKELRKAVSTEPNYVYGYYLLGEIFEREGEKKRAAILYKRAFSVYKKYAGIKDLKGYDASIVNVDGVTRKELEMKGK